MGFYGTSVNFGINCGFMVSICMQGGLVPVNGPDMGTTEKWRFILGAPLVLCSLSTILWLLVIKYDSIDFCIDQGNLVAAKAHLEMVYKFESEQQATETLNRLKELREAAKIEEAK